MFYNSRLLLCIILSFHAHTTGMQLDVKKILALPPIRALSAEDIRRGTFVHERGYTVFGNTGKPVIMYPLHPCIGIMVWRKTLQKGIGLHAHYSNSIEAGVETIKNELTLDHRINCGDDVYVFTFSARMEIGEYNLLWKAGHEGKPQEEHLASVHEILRRGLGIRRNQLHTCWLTDTVDTTLEEGAECMGTDRSIVFDGTTNEDGMPNIQRADFSQIGHMFDGFRLETAVFDFKKSSYCDLSDRSATLPEIVQKYRYLQRYNYVPFTKISEPNAHAITKLPAHLSNPWESNF